MKVQLHPTKTGRPQKSFRRKYHALQPKEVRRVVEPVIAELSDEATFYLRLVAASCLGDGPYGVALCDVCARAQKALLARKLIRVRKVSGGAKAIVVTAHGARVARHIRELAQGYTP